MAHMLHEKKPKTSARLAVVDARQTATHDLRTFTILHCGSTEQGVAAGADVVVMDLTGGLPAGSLPTPSACAPCLAILPEHIAPHDLTRAAKVFGDVAIGWPAPGELLRRCRALLDKPHGAKGEDQLLQDLEFRGLVGASPAFREMLAMIPLLGRSGAPILILGETGTGKELCARALHFASRRRDGPFLAVDCAAIPDHLFENEMFGHARGAFTDAVMAQKGVVGMADHGTLFFDEVDSLSLGAQGKLLRFLEDRKYRPLGAERFFEADVRILAATNSRLDELVEARRFRRDLYYRLNVLALELPPLRDRASDIPLLARHFVAEAAREMGIPPPALLDDTLCGLMNHDWPGNVRELQNLMHRAVVLSDGDTLNVVGLPIGATPVSASTLKAASTVKTASTFKQAREQAVEAFERTFIEQLLARHGGNITHAAREAAKERRAFGRLVKKHGFRRRAAAAGQPKT
jgi:DNA-binding NtrC family response regulator